MYRWMEATTHRLADGWQGGTVKSILDNPRYTGYAIFGRWTKHETLLDPDDVAAGHVVRFRKSTPDRIVRSRRPVHPEIVAVGEFTQVQLLRKSRAAGGMRGRAKLERTRIKGTRPYVLRGLMRCDLCDRRMQGAAIRKGVYYRCLARTLAPGSRVLAEHPRTVNLRENALLDSLNAWIGGVFAPENRDETVAAILPSQDLPGEGAGRHETAKKRLADAKLRLRRHQAAIEAGVDPSAHIVVESAGECWRVVVVGGVQEDRG